MPGNGRAWRLDIGALGLFIVLTLAMLYPYPRDAADHLRDLGDPLEYAWVLGYSAHRLLTAPLQLYDGNIFYPFKGSLAYSDSTLASTIIALPVLLATENPVLATNLLTLLSFVLAGFGAYLLAADLTGSRLAGVVAGVVFAFNPYRMDHLSQIPNVAVHWIPFVFLALHRFLDRRSRRWAAGFAAFLSLQFLSSFYYAYAACIAVAVYLFGFFVWHPRRLADRATTLPILAASAVAGSLLVIVALPYFDVSQRYGMRRTLTEAEAFSASLQSYLAVPAFNRTWGHVDRLVTWGEGEKRLFPGLTAVALATAGLVKGKPRRQAVLFALIGGFAFLLSLGPSSTLSVRGSTVTLPFTMPYRLLFEYLPGFQSLRVPARFAIDVMLAIGVLAGLGAASLARHLTEVAARSQSAARVPYLRAASAAFVVVVLLAEYASFPVPMEPIATGQAIPEVYKWLRGQPAKQVIVELPIDDNAFHQAPYAYFSTYHRWTLVNGWRSFTPPGYAELASTIQGFPSAESLAILANLNVKYVVVHAGQLPALDVAARDARLQGYGDRVRLVQQFGADRVYEITARPAMPAARLSAASACVAEAGRAYPVDLTVDQPSAWLTALPDEPGRLAVAAEWTRADGRVYRQSVAPNSPDRLVRTGQAFRLELAAPAEPGVYDLRLSASPPIAPGWGELGSRVVTVVPKATQPAAGATPTLQVASAELPRLAAAATDTIPLRLTWQAHGSGRTPGVVFVNAYDSKYRVWSNWSGPVSSEAVVGRTWCDGETALDWRAVRLLPDAPPGYYWIEVGLVDPASGERQRILDAQGNPVDKVTVGPLRVSRSPVEAPADVFPVHPVGASLGERIRLLGWTGKTDAPRAGQPLRLRLYWSASGQPGADYSVFVHLYDAAGRLIAQRDGPPGGGAWPTSLWQPGDVVGDETELAIPAGLKPGEYILAAGLYDPATLRRLPLLGGPGLGDDRAALGRLTIAAE